MTEQTSITFVDDQEVAASFRADVEKRTITGLLVPWGKVARTGFAKWRFARGSLYWAAEKRVKLNLGHERKETVGVAVRLQDTAQGLTGSFRIARGEEGDRALSLAAEDILDGFSIEIDFEDGDGWKPDPSDESIRLVDRGALRGVALTGYPAFDDARVERIAAARQNVEKEEAVAEEQKDTTVKAEAPEASEAFDQKMSSLADRITDSHTKLTEDLAQSVGESISNGVKAALEDITMPQDGPQPVRAARFAVVNEPPVYTFDGSGGNSLVRDAWYAARERDDDALERLRKHRKQTEDMAQVALHAMRSHVQFAPQSTSTASDVIPPGYRPDLYVPELAQGRPLVSLCSRGTIGNATPFVVPLFTSSTGVAGDHTEGTNPADGSLAFDSVTVSPGATSGRLTLTREIVDSSNPGIDSIALATMRESYNQQTEAKVYAELNGTATTTADYAEASVITDTRDLLAQYPFVRFAAPTGAAMNQKVTRAFATAEDSTGRPLLPSVGAQNTSGLGNAVNQGWFIDGLTFVPAWSITDTAGTTGVPGDDVVLIVNRSDVWVWESPLLSFRYEEKQGPANIEMNVFGYFATAVLRPAGVFAIHNPAV